MICLMVLTLRTHSLSFCAVVNCCVYTGNKIVFGRGTQVVVAARKSYCDLTSNTKFVVSQYRQLESL